MKTVTWSPELHKVVKNLKQQSLGNETPSTIKDSSLPLNEQNAIMTVFTETVKVDEQTTSPVFYWT